MITNQEKLNVVENRLVLLEIIMNSFISHAEEFQGKYSLEDEFLKYNKKKMVLLEEKQALTNQG
jgi:hypothetical protein